MNRRQIPYKIGKSSVPLATVLASSTWYMSSSKGLIKLAPNIFRTDVSLMTGTFPYLRTVSLAPFVTWALSHWHLFLIQHCPRGTFPYVTHMHAHNNAIFSHFLSTKFGQTPLDQLWANLDRPHLTRITQVLAFPQTWVNNPRFLNSPKKILLAAEFQSWGRPPNWVQKLGRLPNFCR